jgi:hypothetical protein
MPPSVVDLIQTYNELVKIVVTAIISGIVGYGVRWIQAKRQREWEKKKDLQMLKLRKLQEQQNTLRQLVETLIENSRGLVGNWGLGSSREDEFRIKIHNSVASSTSIKSLEDKKLRHLIKKLLEAVEELVEAIPEELGHLPAAEEKLFGETLDRIIHASADELKEPREMEESVRNDLKRIYGDEIQEFVSKYLGRVETIGHLIDQRFEELKAQILEEEV